MTSDIPAGDAGLSWLLEDLCHRVPHARRAIICSADGLPTAAHGAERDEADHLAAVAASLFSVGKSAGKVMGSSTQVRQVIVELADALLFVSGTGTGSRSLLAVAAGRDADPGVLGFEMSQLVKSVQPFLAVPARRPDPAQGPHLATGQRVRGVPARAVGPGAG